MYRIYRFSENKEAYKHILLKRSCNYVEKRSEAVEHEYRLDNSLSRTRRLFFEYAMCNRFDLFVTITFDPSKYNSMEFAEVRKPFCKWLNNYHNRVDSDFCYMLIPEQHESGAWHLHGFCTVPFGFCSPLKIPKNVGGKVQYVPNTKHYLSWPALSEKFGYFSASFIKDYSKAVSYCQKYITKSFSDIRFKNAQLLLKSQGLKKAELVYVGNQSAMWQPEYENEFCAVLWQDDMQTAPLYKHWTYEPIDNIEDLYPPFTLGTAVNGEQIYIDGFNAKAKK